jgi:hypothetical protein
LISLAVLLFAAKLFAEVFHKFRIPVVIGELLAGIIGRAHSRWHWGKLWCGDPTLRENSTKGLIDSATPANNNAVISAKLDGIPLEFNHDQKYGVLTDPFTINLPEHNIWEEKERPGKYIGVAEGYYLLLKPLTLKTGNHTLYYEAGTGEPNPNQ